MDRPLDVIVFGATGFTGRLVAEHLHRAHGDAGPVRWAMAGRSRAKLVALRDELGLAPSLPLLGADATDAASLRALVRETRAVVTTVGPYQRHGEPLVIACAESGTDYVDLCGEPNWMARMIPRLDAPARASGARIVFSCGFDSIPFDLGVVFLQHAATARFGRPLPRVRARVRTIRGGLSGGTLASALETFEQAARDPAIARLMGDPFALTPGFAGPPQPDADGAVFDDLANAWSAPFLMAPINTKNVHRTNALRGHPWGVDFVYDERLLTGRGTAGERRARALAATSRLQTALLGLAPVRGLLRRFGWPRPGNGPGRQQREAGRYAIDFLGAADDGRVLRARVAGDRDPGYGSTSKIVAESALCLIDETDRTTTAGGVWTPGAAMGLALVRRLEAHAGLAFTLEPADDR